MGKHCPWGRDEKSHSWAALFPGLGLYTCLASLLVHDAGQSKETCQAMSRLTWSMDLSTRNGLRTRTRCSMAEGCGVVWVE